MYARHLYGWDNPVNSLDTPNAFPLWIGIAKYLGEIPSKMDKIFEGSIGYG
jgi:hypothetical protein